MLNKTDLVSQEHADELQHLISHVNPAAVIHRTVKGNIDLKHIMGIGAYASRPGPLAASSSADTHDCHGESCQDDGHSHPHHYEVRGISSLQVSVPLLSQPAFDRLDEWIRTVLWEGALPEDQPAAGGASPAISVLRCKGIFQTQSGETYVLQGVRNMYEIAPVEDDAANVGVPDAGKLVFIGKGLDERIRSSLLGVLRLPG